MFHFKKICLFGFEKEEALKKIEILIKSLGIEVVDVATSDLIIVLGGDGSMLHMSKFAHQYQIPILGVNMGKIGFLADISLDNIHGLTEILKGHYITEERQVLHCEVGKGTYYALNEIMLCKSKSTQMIQYEVSVNGQFLYEQTADGIIVATTTGSSAYALSAGGQLMHPSVKAMSLVPICPNKITSCPIVIEDSAIVDIVVHDWKGRDACIACDAVAVDFDSKIRVTIDKKCITFLHPVDYNYYTTLQRKLGWEVMSKNNE